MVHHLIRLWWSDSDDHRYHNEPYYDHNGLKSGCKDKMFKFNWLGTCAPTIQTVIFLDFNSHDTKRTHPSRYRLALECQNWRFHILCISFIVCDNSRVLWYIWNVHICSQYQGRVAHFRFTADQKFYPRIFFISASKAPLNFSEGPLKHFWHSRLATARKMRLRGFWHWSASS